MKITVTGKNVHLRDNFKELVSKKLSKYDRIFDEDAAVAVKATVEHNRQTVEITIHQRDLIYRAEARDYEMNDALDRAVSAIGRQIRKNKTKLKKKIHSGAIEQLIEESTYVEPAEPVDEPVSEEFKVVKSKKFYVKPMTVDEAILQMNLLDHQFFLFRSTENNEINVVYRRKDGKYGLLEPDEE